MPTKTDRILSYLPRTFQKTPRPPVLYAVVDAFGNELLLGENSLSAVMMSHWVDFADKQAAQIDDLAPIASLYGLAPRDSETVEQFREHLKRYVRTFLDGTVTVQGILRVTAEALGLHIADSYTDLDSWWKRPGPYLVTAEPRLDDAATLVFGVTSARAAGVALAPARIAGRVPLADVVLPVQSTLRLKIDGVAVKDTVIPAGPADAGAIVKLINGQAGRNIALLDGSRIDLVSPSTGPASQLELIEGPDDAAEPILGVPPRTYHGSGAQPARIVGTADLHQGADLSNDRYLRVAVNGAHVAEADCADPADSAHTSLDHIRDAINAALGIAVASHDGHFLSLTSPSVGIQSTVSVPRATSQDAADLLLGTAQRSRTGLDAQPATAPSRVDLGSGVDLSAAANVALRIDGQSDTVDCAGFDPAHTQVFEIATAINAKFKAAVASPDGSGIAVTSIKTGPVGEVVFETPQGGDATETIFGIEPRVYKRAAASRARLVGAADLSGGVNLLSQNYVSVAVDGGPPTEINLRTGISDPTKATPSELAAAMNRALGSSIASTDAGHLVLQSPSAGLYSTIEIAPLETIERRRFVTRALVTDEAAQSIFGFVAADATGTPALPARLTGTPDLSRGVDLRGASYLRLSIDGAVKEINCAGARPHATLLAEIEDKINKEFAGQPASDDGMHLVLTSRLARADSQIALEPPLTPDPSDASGILLGVAPQSIRGQDAAGLSFTGLVDLSGGVDLDANAAIALGIDGGGVRQVQLTGAAAAHKSAADLIGSINAALNSLVCRTDGKHLVLTSPTTGSGSEIEFGVPAGTDATRAIFGIDGPRDYRGQAEQPARIVGARGLQSGTDLHVSHFLRISVDGGLFRDFDCAAKARNPAAVSLDEIVASIGPIASRDGDQLVLHSSRAGSSGQIAFQARTAADASSILFGTLDPSAAGADAAPATIVGNVSLLGTVDLSQRPVLRLSVNNSLPADVDVSGKAPGATSLAEIVAAINRRFPELAAATGDDRLQLTAPGSDQGSHLSLLPLRYLEAIEFPPKRVEPDPAQRFPGQQWEVVNNGAADSTVEVLLGAPQGIVGPKIINFTRRWSVRVFATLDSGDTLALKANSESGLDACITSHTGDIRQVPASQILAGPLGGQASVPFTGARCLRDSHFTLSDPSASRVVVLRARTGAAAQPEISVEVTEAELGGVPAPAAASAGNPSRLVGRLRVHAGGFGLFDPRDTLIARLKPGPTVNLDLHRERVISAAGMLYADSPPVMIVDNLTRLFDVTLRGRSENGADQVETYPGSTIGAGAGQDSLVQKINNGSAFGHASRLVKAEELDKSTVLSLPMGTSEWIYLDCFGSRFDQAHFDQDRFPNGFCRELGLFDVARFAAGDTEAGSHSGDCAGNLAAPVFGSKTPGPQAPALIAFRWEKFGPGQFTVNLPLDLPAAYGARFNEARFGQSPGSPETYPQAVTQPPDDSHYLVTLINKVPSGLVKADLVNRVPLGWSPVQMPFRQPQPLTLGGPGVQAAIYLTDEGLTGFIRLLAISPGYWGNGISVSARLSGPAMYDVAVIFPGGRFENARSVAAGQAQPPLVTDLIQAGQMGVLQAKAAGVRADITRDGADSIPLRKTIQA
jgi:hypothetical protein